MPIKQTLTTWNGKSADDIEAIFDQHHNDPDFLDATTGLLKDLSTQKGATWLLKKWLENGSEIKAEHLKRVYGCLPVLQHWESKLHILQCMPYLPINQKEKPKVESFLRGTLTDTNKFVRAWSYNGFYELALRHPEYIEEVQQFFQIWL